jgi:U3 small nucleolar ribonucleoprotein protein IMP4
MLRRNARLRREYLYRKGLEGKERAEYERKRLIREALAGEKILDGGGRLGLWAAAAAAACSRRCRSALSPLGPSLCTPPHTHARTHARTHAHAHAHTHTHTRTHTHTEGKPLPTELRRDAAALKHQVELEDDNTAVPRTHVDDEYARASEREPKVRWRAVVVWARAP